MGDTEQVSALRQGGAAGIDWQEARSVADAKAMGGDAFFCLVPNAVEQPLEGFACPVFVNSVDSALDTCSAKEAVGINGWPAFLQKPQWELAGTLSPAVQAVLQALGKTAIPAPGQPGLIAPRAISMIINEAYFALQDGVSTRADIDTAMKLGTNYPHGPFEWAGILGPGNVYRLLQKLSETDARCTPAPLLKEEAQIP
jgi:3-hydroxybutyryl-CoA dehydrogenase